MRFANGSKFTIASNAAKCRLPRKLNPTRQFVTKALSFLESELKAGQSAVAADDRASSVAPAVYAQFLKAQFH